MIPDGWEPGDDAPPPTRDDRHMNTAVRVSTDGHVRRLTLCRPERYNTITPQLRDELGAAIDAAERDADVRVILLDAEGPAFCSGYDLDWGTGAQSGEETPTARCGTRSGIST